MQKVIIPRLMGLTETKYYSKRKVHQWLFADSVVEIDAVNFLLSDIDWTNA